VGLVILLATPLIAATAWQGAWRPIWLAPLVSLAAAVIMDFVGRVLSWVSGIGNRWLIGASVAAQATGLISGASFMLAVPNFGLPIGLTFGLTIAAIFQVIAAVTFTNYLAGVGRFLGDAGATKNATRLLCDIFAVLAFLAGLGGVLLVVGVLVIVIGMITGGYGFYLAGPVVRFVLLAAAPLLYVVAVMYVHYARVLSQIRASLANASWNSSFHVDRPEDTQSL